MRPTVSHRFVYRRDARYSTLKIRFEGISDFCCLLQKICREFNQDEKIVLKMRDDFELRKISVHSAVAVARATVPASVGDEIDCRE